MKKPKIVILPWENCKRFRVKWKEILFDDDISLKFVWIEEHPNQLVETVSIPGKRIMNKVLSIPDSLSIDEIVTEEVLKYSI